jgi:5-methylcytosine-specific restriction enzyme A
MTVITEVLYISLIVGLGCEMLQEILYRVATEYWLATKEQYANHSIANFIRHDARDAVEALALKLDGRFICKGSAGAGNFAAVPWIAVFDTLVTKSAICGYYVVYLFSSDGKIYLSLNQGTTAVRREFGSGTASILSNRAALMRARLLEFADILPIRKIELHSPGQLPRDYEAGHALGCCYEVDALPGDNELHADFHNALSAYTTLTFRGGLEPSLESMPGQDSYQPALGDLKEIRRYRLHRSIERNYKLAEMVKMLLGMRCQVCGFDFEKTYGELGIGYIEAHHLQPLASLEEGVVIAINPVRDFAVLCSNCHRMIHRQEDSSDVDGLRLLVNMKNHH